MEENWRGLFRERFIIEENTEEKYLRKYDHRTIVEELEHFIEQELDKAREEGRREYARELLDDYYQPDSDSIEIDVSEIQSELSKLTTK